MCSDTREEAAYLLLDVQASEEVVKLSLVTSSRSDADFGRRWWRQSLHARHPNLIFANLLKSNAFKIGSHV